MYPNPQDVLPLPPRPNLEQYRRRAKELARACRDHSPDAIAAWARKWIDDLYALSDIEPGERDRTRGADQVATFARERLGSDCALTQAQFVIARAHGFPGWKTLARHIDALVASAGGAATLEAAVDAIVTGDVERLRRLIAKDPKLIHERSTREHHATLLHYVSANGVENYRQRTPKNIVDIARLLLDAGAEVDAEADVYGGGATTLGLVVTSAHPRAAGVQNDLADLLIVRGARVAAGTIQGCLANGCPEAAEHLASRGAPVDLEEACGIGDLDRVRRVLDAGTEAITEKAIAGLNMAGWYDRREVIALLHERGFPVGTRIEPGQEGHTVLHLASYNAHVELARMLLALGAPVNVNDDRYGTPPFVWARHAWLVEGKGPIERYRSVLWMLAEAGAVVESRFLGGDELEQWPELLTRLSENATRAS